MGAHSGHRAKRTNLLLLGLGIAIAASACGADDAGPAATSATPAAATTGATPTAEDELIPQEDARRYHQAASQPKQVRWYTAGHELSCTARRDAMAWLARHIRIDPERYRCRP